MFYPNSHLGHFFKFEVHQTAFIVRSSCCTRIKSKSQRKHWSLSSLCWVKLHWDSNSVWLDFTQIPNFNLESAPECSAWPPENHQQIWGAECILEAKNINWCICLASNWGFFRLWSKSEIWQRWRQSQDSGWRKASWWIWISLWSRTFNISRDKAIRCKLWAQKSSSAQRRVWQSSIPQTSCLPQTQNQMISHILDDFK